MRKSFIALSLSMAMLSGQAFADVATFNALASAGIPMSEQQAATLQNAEAGSTELEAAVAAVVEAAAASTPTMAATIATAAMNAVPSMIKVIRDAAIAGAPGQKVAINQAAANAYSNGNSNAGARATSIGATINTNGIPTVSGAGGSSRVASPN